MLEALSVPVQCCQCSTDQVNNNAITPCLRVLAAACVLTCFVTAPQKEIEQYYIKLGVLFPTYHLMYWMGLQVGGAGRHRHYRLAATNTTISLWFSNPYAVRCCAAVWHPDMLGCASTPAASTFASSCLHARLPQHTQAPPHHAHRRRTPSGPSGARWTPRCQPRESPTPTTTGPPPQPPSCSCPSPKESRHESSVAWATSRPPSRMPGAGAWRSVARSLCPYAR